MLSLVFDAHPKSCPSINTTGICIPEHLHTIQVDRTWASASGNSDTSGITITMWYDTMWYDTTKADVHMSLLIEHVQMSGSQIYQQ